MPLSNIIHTVGNAPDHTAALIEIAKTRPNIVDAFNKGRAAADQHANSQAQNKLALLAYDKAKRDADLAVSLYPMQSEFARKTLLAQMAAVDSIGKDNTRSNAPSNSVIDTSAPTGGQKPVQPESGFNIGSTQFNLAPDPSAPFQPAPADFGGSGFGLSPQGYIDPRSLGSIAVPDSGVDLFSNGT